MPSMFAKSSRISTRFLVIGSGGRLGASLMQFFEKTNIPAIGWARQDVDLADAGNLRNLLADTDFRHVIISAALTSVDACENQPALAHAVNAKAPGLIAEIVAARGGRCLYVSTDYVYDGTLPGMKSETAPLAPLGVYARTKREGESRVLAASPQHLVARTSWIFGPQRPSFVDQLLRQARQGEPLKAIADKFSAPSYSNDLAKALADLAEHPQAVGIYNVVNAAEPDVSWHTLGCETLRLAYSRGLISSPPPPCEPISVSDMSHFLATRPVHTTASSSKLETLLGRRMRPWQEALAEYLADFQS